MYVGLIEAWASLAHVTTFLIFALFFTSRSQDGKKNLVGVSPL
jgi:hypothetical protein